MAITKDQVYGLDLAWFGQPFVQATADALGDNMSLDVCFYAEPFTVSYYNGLPVVTPAPVYNATMMFMMF